MVKGFEEAGLVIGMIRCLVVWCYGRERSSGSLHMVVCYQGAVWKRKSNDFARYVYI